MNVIIELADLHMSVSIRRIVWNELAIVNTFGEQRWGCGAEKMNLHASHRCSVLLAHEPYTSVLRRLLKSMYISLCVVSPYSKPNFLTEHYYSKKIYNVLKACDSMEYEMF